jgi:putative cardiolipin synthase
MLLVQWNNFGWKTFYSAGGACGCQELLGSMWKRSNRIGAIRRVGSRLLLGASLMTPVSFLACSNVSAPESGVKIETRALAKPESTTLGRLVANHTAERDGASGFELVTTGRDAFRSLVALSRVAEKTLDLQYYIWRANRTGRLLLAELIAAADRGVRVRLLLDDMDLAWDDKQLERLGAHRNIEVRIFNPFANRDVGFLDFLFDFNRVNHRMHNKAFIADNSIAVIGGRNVGDRYFSANEQANYRDLDLYTVGPIVQQASASFDIYWNSDWSVPAREVNDKNNDKKSIAAIKMNLVRTAEAGKSPYDIEDGEVAAKRFIKKAFGRLLWTKESALLADSPNKPKTKRSDVLRSIRPMLDGGLQSELLLEMAYLIPGDSGVKRLCKLAAKGIRVRVLTNSFQSNDVVTAYAGYRKFRESLVLCGVELYEMRPDPGFVRRDWNWLKPSSTAYLHTKAAVLDGEDVLIGSFNLDPRSIKLNTEIALVVRDRQLAKQVTDFITDGMTPANAYRLELKDGDLVWVGTEEGDAVRRNDEPGFGSWRGFVTMLIALLPIEGQL